MEGHVGGEGGRYLLEGPLSAPPLQLWQSSDRILDYVRSQVSAGGPGAAPGSLLDSLLVQLLRTVLPTVVYHTGLVHLHLGACSAVRAVTHTTPSHWTSQA